MPYDIDSIRNSLQKAVSGKRQDPDEFKPPKVSDKAGLKYRFFVLPPVLKGDKVKGGVAKSSMDNFFIPHGDHWVNNKPYACPRVCANEECELCNTGFELIKKAKAENKSKDFMAAIRNQWMPSTSYYVNVYFTNFKGNPDDLRGTVRYYKAPKTVLDIWIAALTRDDSGDEEDPKAFGVFFDEMKAFTFELVAVKDGSYNGYKTSNFLHNNGVPIAIARNEDGDPDQAAIKTILDNRIDIFSKLDKPDSTKVARLASMILTGDDGDDAPSGGFDADESVPEPKTTTKLYTESTTPTVKARKPSADEIGKVLIPDSDDDDEEEEVKPKAKSKPEPKPEPKVESKPKKLMQEIEDDDVDMEDLLSQLSDED